MKALYLSIFAIYMCISCASSQNAIAMREAQKDIDSIKSLIKLTDAQTEKIVAIQTAFLIDSQKLNYSPSYNTQLEALKEKRIAQIKEVLSREQFVKFDLIESGRIKRVPIRSN